MATMNISLPERLKSHAEQQVASGRYASVSDYVRDLVRRDEERAESFARLRALGEEGRASGPSDLTPEDIRQDVKAELRKRAASSRAV